MAASIELAKWHNSVDKGFRQGFVILKKYTRQTHSPHRTDPVGMGFRFGFACADFCQTIHKPTFAPLRPLNRAAESGTITTPSGRKRKPGPYSFLNPIACKKMSTRENCILKETSFTRIQSVRPTNIRNFILSKFIVTI